MGKGRLTTVWRLRSFSVARVTSPLLRLNCISVSKSRFMIACLRLSLTSGKKCRIKSHSAICSAIFLPFSENWKPFCSSSLELPAPESLERPHQRKFQLGRVHIRARLRQMPAPIQSGIFGIHLSLKVFLRHPATPASNPTCLGKSVDAKHF